MPPKYQTDRNPEFDDRIHTQSEVQPVSKHRRARINMPEQRENPGGLAKTFWRKNTLGSWDVCSIWETPHGGYAIHIERNIVHESDLTASQRDKVIIAGSDFYKFPTKGKYHQACHCIKEWENEGINTSELEILLARISYATPDVAYDDIDVDGVIETETLFEDPDWYTGES